MKGPDKYVNISFVRMILCGFANNANKMRLVCYAMIVFRSQVMSDMKYSFTTPRRVVAVIVGIRGHGTLVGSVTDMVGLLRIQ